MFVVSRISSLLLVISSRYSDRPFFFLSVIFADDSHEQIIAMRYNDVRDGTDVVSGVLQKYAAALDKKKMISRDDLFQDWLSLKQGHTTTPKSVGLTAWYV